MIVSYAVSSVRTRSRNTILRFMRCICHAFLGTVDVPGMRVDKAHTGGSILCSEASRAQNCILHLSRLFWAAIWVAAGTNLLALFGSPLTAGQFSRRCTFLHWM